MCDIYDAKCEKKDCNVLIDMHLEDFATERDEIEVFCGSHTPPKENRRDGVLWKVKKGKSNTRIFVRALTKNARTHWEGNCYNDDCIPIEIFGKKGERDVTCF